VDFKKVSDNNEQEEQKIAKASTIFQCVVCITTQALCQLGNWQFFLGLNRDYTTGKNY
jgi:hypothetical protein